MASSHKPGRQSSTRSTKNLGAPSAVLATVGQLLLISILLLLGWMPPASAQGDPSRPPDFELGFLVLLIDGDRSQAISAEAQDSIRMHHGMHVMRLMSTGVVALAAPFQVQPIADLGDALAIEVYRVESRAEVDRLMAQDPAIRAGMFRYRVYEIWLPPLPRASPR